MMSNVVVPIACEPYAIPAEEREEHFARGERLFTKLALERRHIEGGVMFRFPVAAELELGRWIANERRCCPFLSLSIDSDAAAGTGSVWLRMTGPEAASAFFPTQLPAGRHNGES